MTDVSAPPQSLSIAEVSDATGLSIDTLRWYERQQLFPPVTRDSGRRRRYSVEDMSRIRLMLRLRRTGMPVKDIRRFVELLAGGPETHRERLALLQSHRSRILSDMDQLAKDLDAVDFKIGHYTELVGDGLDCQYPA
ncbi:MerR family transcriptional regulator [Antrihabitans cavernicola]|uniref:MerR family transcriptional regulator n=1 Tax=Antrihabitans cavernicola TaxID=2495913 RepID=A0A5A7S9S1_9NOCA|nr:MerR family transcriptional regulator [Spelaeibacter cavernicola]KAA0022928.1 MerR family transcriptional regulator [Spelaeibacter cavernicola]